MNRQILFRGKHKSSGKWVEGNYEYYHKPEKHMISCHYTQETYGVIPETIGQFTGLTDKNGKLIFEGDILKYKRGDIAKVVYGDGSFYGLDKNLIIDNIYVKGLVEVIGNIHDNPELLKEKEDE